MTYDAAFLFHFLFLLSKYLFYIKETDCTIFPEFLKLPSTDTYTTSKYNIPTNATAKLINTIVSMRCKIPIKSQYRYTPLLPLSNELTKTAQYRSCTIDSSTVV